MPPSRADEAGSSWELVGNGKAEDPFVLIARLKVEKGAATVICIFLGGLFYLVSAGAIWLSRCCCAMRDRFLGDGPVHVDAFAGRSRLRQAQRTSDAMAWGAIACGERLAARGVIRCWWGSTKKTRS